MQRFGEWGGNISGKTADPVIAQAYNRRYGVNDYALFSPYGLGPSLDGFYQFNYSPIGIYRRANWVATIHGAVSAFWSAEIWGTDNRYGRYQGYGALEVLYHGQAKANSGMDMVGWDWNHEPGTMTIVLPFEKLAAENTREDVRSQLNYGAALSFYDNQSGVYACDFKEQNGGAWGSKPNHNASFVWKKSWFCFANQIICLGSDIANDDKTNPTVTTLFQGVLPARDTAITLDGTSITTFPYSANVSSTSAHWLLDAYKTGYYVYPGTGIQVSRNTQTTPPVGTGTFSKAWINHGTAPAGVSYEYVVFPNTTGAEMAAHAVRYAGADKPYQVLQRDSTAHIVKWKPDGKIGYAIFTNTALSEEAQSAGMVSSVSRPCMLMTQIAGNSNAWVTVVDPVPDIKQTDPVIVTLNCAARSVISKDSCVTVLQLSPQIKLSIDVTGPYGGRGFSLGTRYSAGFVLETVTAAQPLSGLEHRR